MESNSATDLQVHNILVPIDFSACSRKALWYATNVARVYKAKLTLLYVVSVQLGMPQHLRKETLHLAKCEMKQFQADLESKAALRGIQYQVLVRQGKSWDIISRIVRLQNTDLIVMGTHGRTGLRKLVLGSFAEDVFRRAPCPVLTVGPQIPDWGAGQSATHILFPVDGSHASKAAEPYAYQLGRAPGAQLTLLSVVHAGFFPNGNSAGGERLQSIKEDLQATGVYAAWRQGGVTPSVLAEMGQKVDTILGVADAKGADLIILAVSPRESTPGKFDWDDAYQVVCSAHCPVLTVRNVFPDPYFKRLLEMEPVHIGGKSLTRDN